MPTSATASSSHRRAPSDLLVRLGSTDPEVKLRALREVKNQIIGNRTKKLSFLKLGAVPAVAAALSQAQSQAQADLLVQSAAVLGSFACGFDAGVRAVLDAGAFPNLINLLSYPDEKVVDAGARSLRMIYQSKLAPKYDFLKEKSMGFLLSLLNSKNETVTGLGASIIIHSCKTVAEQNTLCHPGVLKKLIYLLEGSSSQKDASLESLATIIKNNPEGASKFVSESGIALSSVIDLTKDRYPRTRLLACMCLIVIRNTSPCYLQDVGIKTKLVHLLLELLDDPGQIGEDSPFVFSSLIAQKEDLQRLAFEANAIDKLYNHLQKDSLHPRRFQGILLVLADLCSQLESCRSRFLSLKILDSVTHALTHDNADVRAAACICLRSVSRSIKVAALGAISNIVVNFATHKSVIVKCGGLKVLVQLSKSMDATLRLNALWALKNLMFLADNVCKEGILLELTPPLLSSLICDPEPSVQEQALALVRNLVDGCINSVEYVFAEDGILLDAIGRQLQSASKAEIGIQGMYVLGNISSGNEFHKEAVMQQLLPQVNDGARSFILKFLQNNDSRLRTAAMWAIINLTFPSSPGASGRVVKLRNAGIVCQIKTMVNDPCVDVELRVKTALGQFVTSGAGST
ncbi:uncharacterized protein LOC133877469 isoform X2 [Alnus glutinosa]|uniref:uncharacterized protein LOC133877469 isoform X2 n=1 Tax=Alnus glutinosa TaxID=3517 RepID=UPI002D78FBBE|nr:uncharacterized protein LOC133877469 isoform X2 [Alnus glutinosa]